MDYLNHLVDTDHCWGSGYLVAKRGSPGHLGRVPFSHLDSLDQVNMELLGLLVKLDCLANMDHVHGHGLCMTSRSWAVGMWNSWYNYIKPQALHAWIIVIDSL